MNQDKIGKFIAELRKEKNMTQQELADKLSVTDRAIGNWENGRRLPDYTIIRDLCDELDISINELLSGEKMKQDEYFENAEKNFILLKQKGEIIERKLKTIQTILNIISITLLVIDFLIFTIHLILNYLNIENYHGELFELTFPIMIFLSLLFSFISCFSRFRDEYQIIGRNK